MARMVSVAREAAHGELRPIASGRRIGGVWCVCWRGQCGTGATLAAALASVGGAS